VDKADDFEARVNAVGQTLTLYSFSGYASGDYVNPYWNAPDPDDPDYPSSGGAPGPSYGTAQSVKALVQPARGGDGGEVFVRTPWGDEVKAVLRAYFPASVNVAHRDRIEYGRSAYWVARIEEWFDGDELVYRLVYLTEEVS